MNAFPSTDEVTTVATVAGVFIAFLTFCVLVRYTNETIKLRRAAESQLKTAQDQLSVAEKALQQAIKERRLASHPIFIWAGSAGGSSSAINLSFTNRGGPISSCYVNSPSARSSAVIPRAFIGNGELGTVEFHFNQPLDSFSFELCFTSQHGEVASQQFTAVCGQDDNIEVRLTRSTETIG